MWVWLRVTAMQTHLVRFGPVTGDSQLCSLWTRYIGDSKTDPWDDPEIRTRSCSEDQISIRIQNRVISCECLFISPFQFQCLILLFHTDIYIILYYSVHGS